MTFHGAKAVIVIGRYMQEKLFFNYGFRRSIVIPNWASPISYVPPQIPPKFQFTYSGNLGFAHDFRLLPRFASYMADRTPHFQFVGRGRRLQDVVESMKRLPCVKSDFLDLVSINEHSKTLSESSFLLVSQSPRTIGDIVPSKIYSYLAAGRPVVFFGSRRSEIGELLSNYDIGVTVELEQDIPGAIEWIDERVTDERLYLWTCERARTAYEQTGGVSRAANQVLSVLANIFSRK